MAHQRKLRTACINVLIMELSARKISPPYVNESGMNVERAALAFSV